MFVNYFLKQIAAISMILVNVFTPSTFSKLYNDPLRPVQCRRLSPTILHLTKERVGLGRTGSGWAPQGGGGSRGRGGGKYKMAIWHESAKTYIGTIKLLYLIYIHI